MARRAEREGKDKKQKREEREHREGQRMQERTQRWMAAEMNKQASQRVNEPTGEGVSNPRHLYTEGQMSE